MSGKLALQKNIFGGSFPLHGLDLASSPPFPNPALKFCIFLCYSFATKFLVPFKIFTWFVIQYSGNKMLTNI